MKTTKNVARLAVAAFALVGIYSTVATARAAETKTKKTSTKTAPAVRALNNTICPVMGTANESMGEGVTVDHKGYRVNLCCASCRAKFKSNPDAYLQAAFASSPSARSASSASSSTPAGETAKKSTKKKAPAVKTVNNAHCPVAGSAIGSMGAGTSVTYKGYKVSLCCGGCNGRFNENPDAYLQAALADSKRQ